MKKSVKTEMTQQREKMSTKKEQRADWKDGAGHLKKLVSHALVGNDIEIDHPIKLRGDSRGKIKNTKGDII